MPQVPEADTAAGRRPEKLRKDQEQCDVGKCGSAEAANEHNNRSSAEGARCPIKEERVDKTAPEDVARMIRRMSRRLLQVRPSLWGSGVTSAGIRGGNPHVGNKHIGGVTRWPPVVTRLDAFHSAPVNDGFHGRFEAPASSRSSPDRRARTGRRR